MKIYGLVLHNTSLKSMKVYQFKDLIFTYNVYLSLFHIVEGQKNLYCGQLPIDGLLSMFLLLDLKAIIELVFYIIFSFVLPFQSISYKEMNELFKTIFLLLNQMLNLTKNMFKSNRK